MNGKGDKTRQGVNWKRYRAEHERIFGKRNAKENPNTESSDAKLWGEIWGDIKQQFPNAAALLQMHLK